jgi:hypothetical protein
MTLPFIEASATVRLRSAFARVSQAASDFFRPTTSDNSTALFRFPLHDAKEFVRGQPERFPNIIIFARDADCFKRDARSIRRDRREDAVCDFFLTRAVEIGYPRQPGLVQTRFADRRKKVRRETLPRRKQRRRARSDAPYRGLFVSWQYDGGEKGDGEREYEDDQIYKSAEKEFKNTEEPALAINVAD